MHNPRLQVLMPPILDLPEIAYELDDALVLDIRLIESYPTAQRMRIGSTFNGRSVCFLR